jgi:hypothetical protein
MNAVKRLLGYVWILMAPALVAFMVWQAVDKISKASEATKSNTTLQWVIILLIFIPICIGFLIFGYYSVKGYYDHLPESSSELTDY